MSESPSARLKAATAVLHQRVEDGVDILRRTETREGATELLRLMEAFYGAFEPLLAKGLAGRVPPAFLEPRSPRLRADLDALAPGWLPLSPSPMPELADPLGALYVVEGAALGGQIIGRHFVKRLGFRSVFFSEGAGPRWRAFRAVLDETPNYDLVERTAIATFLAFERAVVAPLPSGGEEVVGMVVDVAAERRSPHDPGGVKEDSRGSQTPVGRTPKNPTPEGSQRSSRLKVALTGGGGEGSALSIPQPLPLAGAKGRGAGPLTPGGERGEEAVLA